MPCSIASRPTFQSHCMWQKRREQADKFLWKCNLTYLDIIRSNVVFPKPFLPTNPYLLPYTNVISAAVRRTLKHKTLWKYYTSEKITLISTQYSLNTTGTIFLEGMKKINDTCRTCYKDLKPAHFISVYLNVLFSLCFFLKPFILVHFSF